MWGQCVCHSEITQEESWMIFCFNRFKGRFTKIFVGAVRKTRDFWSKVARAIKFCHFVPSMNQSKFTNDRFSEKLSICQTEHAEGGAILQHLPE